MKKTLLTIAILLGLSLGVSAQGGLFGYGNVSEENNYSAGNRDQQTGLLLPTQHGSDTDQPSVPVGSGIVLLIGFGVAYALKNRKEK